MGETWAGLHRVRTKILIIMVGAVGIEPTTYLPCEGNALPLRLSARQQYRRLYRRIMPMDMSADVRIRPRFKVRA